MPDQVAVRGVQFTDVAWTDSRFIAIGVALEGGAVVLDSTDGITWHRQPSLGPNVDLQAVAASIAGVVLIGTINDKPFSWKSPTGLEWTRGTEPFPFKATGTDVIKVTDVTLARNRGWLAVGREDPECHVYCGLEPVRALAWTSADGLRWTLVPAQASLRGGGMSSVTLGFAGYLAGGVASSHAALWLSSDGSTWLRIPDDPVFHGRGGSEPSEWSMVNGVARVRAGLVAVGMDGPASGGGPSVRAWWSATGERWASAPVELAVPSQAFSVGVVKGGLLAVGPSGASGCRGGIWFSADGRSWRCDATDLAFDGFGPYAAAGSPTVEVAVGLTSVGWDPSTGLGLPGAIWWRPAR